MQHLIYLPRWEHVVARQCQDAIHETKELYSIALNEYFYKLPGPKDLETVENILKVRIL